MRLGTKKARHSLIKNSAVLHPNPTKKMSLNSCSIVYLLFDRESGFSSKLTRSNFFQISKEIADHHLIEAARYKGIDIDKDVRSGYALASNSKAHVAISHANRSVTVIDVRKMTKISQLPSNDRTVWCLAYHPSDPDLFATGSLGGLVQIYRNYVTYLSYRVEIDRPPTRYGLIIASMCFHPKQDILIFSTRKEVRLLNWQTGAVVRTIPSFAAIKYLKYNMLNNTLVTIQQYMQESSKNCMLNFFYMVGSVSLVLNSILEPCSVRSVAKIFVTNLKNLCCSCARRCTNDTVEEDLPTRMNDLDVTLKVWHNKLLSLPEYRLEVTDDVKCEFFYKKIKKFARQCCEQEKFVKRKLYQFVVQGEIYIKLALQVALEQSWELRHEYLRQRCTCPTNFTYGHPMVLYPPNILQVWDFDEENNFEQVWRASIANCESHNDCSADISKCGTKIAILKRNKFHGSRLRVFSLERHNLGLLLHNIDIFMQLKARLIGVTFSPSGSYLIAVTRSGEYSFSYLNVFNLGNRVDKRKSRLLDVVGDIGFISWLPHPGDGVLLTFTTHKVLHWT